MIVRIVTDSTSDVTTEMAQGLGVTVVAQNVHFGTQTFKDNVTITPEDFYSMLAKSAELPTTSQASPGEFKEAYDRLGADADGIVSLHISSKISGTWNSARLGAAQSTETCPIEVIDSAQASMGLGLAVVATAEAANRGASHADVVSAARDSVARAQCICLFETLEYLQKGGRIGRGPGAPWLRAQDQTDDHRTGRRDPSPGQGPNLPQGPDLDEADGTRLRAGRVPGGDAQHHP